MNANKRNKILIKNGLIVDTIKNKEHKANLYIEDGRIVDIKDNIKVNAEEVFEIDAKDHIVVPGLVDMHVHLRDPGFEEKETIETGAQAALAGGITSIACMPNTKPAIDSPSLVNYITGKAAVTGCNVYPVAAMTRGLEGREITEMGLLAEAGASGFSDDGRSVADAKLMYEIMRYSKQFEKPLILHEEVYSFSKYGIVHEGKYSTKLGLEGISRLADDLMIGRDIVLAKKTGARIHITHISTAGAVDMIRAAKADGVGISCDVTAHHFFFNDSYLKSFNTNLKVKPPIRSATDQEALIEGVADGTIDAIVSDHAPHLDTEKNTTFKLAQFGTTGLETLFAASYTKLCREKGIPLVKLAELMGTGPAKILDIDAGTIKVGGIADITVIDTKKEFTVNAGDFRSKSSNSAFIGQQLFGQIIYTISNGKIEYESG
ncbi:MAG: dihydroorotase [Candidatus Humimicrobiaceae bacterium]